VIPLALACLAAQACGGGEDGRPKGPPAMVAPGARLAVSADEYSFTPSRAVLRSPGALTVSLANDGSLPHDLRLRRDGDDAGGTPTLPPGDSGTARLRLRPGRYELLCTVGDHAELGMTGEIRVKE
jgi:plastocyanin